MTFFTPAQELDLTPPETVLDADSQLWLIENFERLRSMLHAVDAGVFSLVRQVKFAQHVTDVSTSVPAGVGTGLELTLAPTRDDSRVLVLAFGRVRSIAGAVASTDRRATGFVRRTSGSPVSFGSILVGRVKNESDTVVTPSNGPLVCWAFETPGLGAHTYELFLAAPNVNVVVTLQSSGAPAFMLGLELAP